MGYEQATIGITVSLSRHNSERDVEHNRLWADLSRRVYEVVTDPQYQPIIADISGGRPVCASCDRDYPAEDEIPDSEQCYDCRHDEMIEPPSAERPA